MLDENRTYLCEKSELEAEKFIKYLHTKSRISNKLTLNQIFGTCLDSSESHQVINIIFYFYYLIKRLRFLIILKKICWCRENNCNWSYDRCCHNLLTANKHLINDIDLIGFNLLDLHFPKLFKETIVKFIFLFDIELKAIVYYWNS